MRAALVTLATTIGLCSVVAAQPLNPVEDNGGERAGGSVQQADELDIARLIKELGDGSWRVREAASQRLFEIGIAALPAIREARLSADLEIKSRATTLEQMITNPSPDQLIERRSLLQVRFHEADYPAAVNHARALTVAEDAPMIDWLWLGHACQLAGEWREAVDAYGKVAGFIDADLRAGEVPGEAAQPAAERGQLRENPPRGRLRGDPGPRPLTDRQREQLVTQRSALMLWIARMQDAELNDANAAADTLGDALAFLEASETPINHLWFEMADAYPRLLLDAGRPAAAIEAWKHSVDLLQRSGNSLRDRRLVDVEQVYGALALLADDEPRPDVPWIVNVPDETAVTLNVADDAGRARAYQVGTYDHYAFAPPSGLEFATIEFACDIEQRQLRYGGQFSCFVMAHDPPGRAKDFGSMHWTRDEAGRAVISKMIEVPAGAGLVHIRVGQADAFTVHGVTVKATFRPATNDPQPIQAGAWMQTELHPADGTLTWGEMALRNRTARSNVAPGEAVLRFAAGEGGDVLERPFRVKPGRRYGLFFNVDSPFDWQQLDLELGSDSPVSSPQLSIQRLDAGGYLGIWCDGSKLLVARSDDLLSWSEPHPLPFNSVFNNIEPATYRTPDGTVYLAFFSNRLDLQVTHTGGYRLWLTSTRDGQTWEPLRLIEVPELGGWPLNSPSMLTGPDGRQWLFWRNKAASADTFNDITELVPLTVPVGADGERITLWNVDVSVGRHNRFHMVCDNFGDGIYHLTSTTGRTWSPPQLIVAKQEERGPSLSRPQLILHGDVGYVIDARGQLHAIDLTKDPVAVGDALNVSSYLVPVASRVFREGDDLFMIVGQDTTWLLRATLDELAAAREARTGSSPAHTLSATKCMSCVDGLR